MLRFATRAVATAALVRAPLARQQATDAAAAAASTRTSNTTASSSSSGNNTQSVAAVASAGATGNRSNVFRGYTPTRQLPRFEIFDVRDNPAHGTMTRVSVDGKQLLVSQYPQLGPRKVDPNDRSAQFDSERRISVRLRHRDLAALVSVVEDRMPCHRVTNNAYDLTFAKTATGYTLSGTVHRVMSPKTEEWAMAFDKQFAVMLEHFLQSALTDSFGFEPYYQAMSSSSSSSSSALPADGARRDNNNNNGGGGNARRNRNRNRTSAPEANA